MMRYTTLALFILVFVAACAPQAATPAPPADATLCPAERPEICTQEYAPVCGSDNQTYGNGCTACTYSDVVWHVPGECDEGEEAPPLTVQYQEGFTMPSHAITRYAVGSDGTLTMTILASDGTVTEETSRQLSRDAIATLEGILADLPELQPRYESDLPVADAGIVNLTIRDREVIVDPNVEQAWPQELLALHGWIAENIHAEEKLVHECTERPESCYEIYQPVCGSDGTTYANDCIACSEGAESYTDGACEDDGRFAGPGFVECTERPEVCTKEYRPVCAQVDTGIRCVTEPCPSTKEQTYGNACEACADESVLGYVEGACPLFPGEGEFVLCEGERCIIVDDCPEEYDVYASQIGPACAPHVDKGIAQEWERCSRSTQCDGACAYVSSTTDGEEIEWNPPQDGWRCVAQGYQNYLIHTSGLRSKDEFGRESVAIA